MSWTKLELNMSDGKLQETSRRIWNLAKTAVLQ